MNDNLRSAFDSAKTIPVTDWIPETVSDEDLFGDTGNEYIQSEQPSIQQPQMQGAQPNGNVQMNGGQIPTELVLVAIDTLGCIVIPMGVKMASGRVVTKKQVALTAKEKSDLHKPTEDYLKTVNFSLSPLEQFLLAIGAIYGGKIITILSEPVKVKTSPQSPDMDDLNDKNQLLNSRGKVRTSTRKVRSDSGIPKK